MTTDETTDHLPAATVADDKGALTPRRVLRFGCLIALMSVLAVGIAVWTSLSQSASTRDVYEASDAALSLQQALDMGNTAGIALFARSAALKQNSALPAKQDQDAGLDALKQY